MKQLLRIGLMTIVVLYAGTQLAKGQESVRFHAEAGLFVAELRDLFGGRHADETARLIQDLESANKAGYLEENHWIDLARKVNRLDYLKARPFPDFYLMIETFVTVAGIQSRSDYINWSMNVDKLLETEDKNLGRVNTFLTFTRDFIQQGLLMESPSCTWISYPKTGAFQMDTSFSVRQENVTLVCRSGSDSTVIFSASGTFYPETGSWIGDSGLVTWERLDIPADQVQVKLRTYRIDIRRSVYTIDSVNLIDKRYFTNPLTGVLENKVQPGISRDQAGYPRFTSYELKNRIKDIYPGMDYEGGFSLQGKKVLGTGEPSQKSVLTIFYNERPLIRLASTYFVFQPEQARGINTEASIYLEADSIYHPGLLFQYNKPRNELAFIRDGQGLSPSRFFDYYHQFDLDVEMIRWNPGDSLLFMSSMVGSQENRAAFESSDFFSIGRYNEILIEDIKHPVAAVKQCADFLYSRSFTLRDLAYFMDRPEHLVEKMLLRLSFLGMVRYNVENQQIEVLQRAYDFLKKKAGSQDYDIIQFESLQEPPNPNAILNLNTNILRVFSVKQIELSKARNVILYPDRQIVDILKNREILFTGNIRGGLAYFSGYDFRFRYDDYSILMDSVSVIRFQVYEDPVKKGDPPKLADVTSLVENTSGTLFIDRPDNKSGFYAGAFPEYPMLVTDSNAYVYYDQKEILNGIYPRETFNFSIHPFTLRGLNLTTFADSLNLPGRFVTADIFPPIELILRHQKDHSLGFQTLRTPEEGYPIYKGKGRFFNLMAMSKSGLRGSGTLQYLNSTLESDDFLFLPDQVTTLANTFAVNQDTVENGNPEAVGQEMAVSWMPEKDRMVASGKDNPLSMYGKVEFDGELSLEPGSLTGKGTMRFERYSVTSDQFHFYQESYDASNAEFRIFDDSTGSGTEADSDRVGFIARQVDVAVSTREKKAGFRTVSPSSSIDFPHNQFTGQSGSFIWDMNLNLMGFDSTLLRMSQSSSDQLEIKSKRTFYDVDNKLIRATETEFIDVADMRIFPADRNLMIREKADLDTLRQAVLVSRDTGLIHRISGASVKIIDRSNYFARGNYQYRDIAGREFSIHFSDIHPDAAGHSQGKGTIGMNSGFALSPAFRYYGEVEWHNDEPLLLFDGQVQIVHSCNENIRQWIRFTDRINPDSVSIPIDSVTVNDQNERLFKGFYLSNQPVELYSTFIGPHLRYSDQPLISAWGRLWYDESRSRYLLASGQKKSDPAADAPLLSFDANRCICEADGKTGLGVDLGQVKLTGAGRLIHDLRQDSVSGTMTLTLDFFMDDKILDYMARSINNASRTEPVNYADPLFRESFRYLLGKTKADELLGQLSMMGRWRKVPEELLHTLVMTDVHLGWNPETGSYQSAGKIGIANIRDKGVNKKVDGYLEIVHKRSGDTFSLYLELERQGYFFFTYSRGILQCISGPKYEKFNTLLRSTKEAKRIQETQPWEPGFQYYPGQYRQVQEFLMRFGVER